MSRGNLPPGAKRPRRKTVASRRRAVHAAWELFEDDEPDISTERLIAMIADATGEDYGDVVSFIAEDVS